MRSGSGSSTSRACDPPLLETPLPSLLHVPIASVQSGPMPPTIDGQRPLGQAGERGRAARAPVRSRSNAASAPKTKSPRRGWAVPPRYRPGRGRSASVEQAEPFDRAATTSSGARSSGSASSGAASATSIRMLVIRGVGRSRKLAARQAPVIGTPASPAENRSPRPASSTPPFTSVTVWRAMPLALNGCCTYSPASGPSHDRTVWRASRSPNPQPSPPHQHRPVYVGLAEVPDRLVGQALGQRVTDHDAVAADGTAGASRC